MNSTVLSSRLNAVIDGSDDARWKSTPDSQCGHWSGKARSPMMERRAGGTTSWFVVVADRRCRRVSTSATRRRVKMAVDKE